MGVDDDEEEDDEDDVSEVAEDGPDLVVRGVGVGSQRFDDEVLLDDVVETVGDAGEEAGSRADEPAKRAGFVITSVSRFFFFGFFFFLVCFW